MTPGQNAFQRANSIDEPMSSGRPLENMSAEPMGASAALHSSDEEDEHSDDDMSDEVSICKTLRAILYVGLLGGGGLSSRAVWQRGRERGRRGGGNGRVGRDGRS